MTRNSIIAEEILLTQVLESEQRQLVQRLAVGAGFSGGLVLLAAWPAAVICCAVLWIGQAMGLAYTNALLGAPDGSSRRRALVSFAPLGHFVGAASYGILAPGYWFMGGPVGQVVATLLLVANAQHVWLHYSAVPRLAVTGIACQLIWLLILSLVSAAPSLIPFLHTSPVASASQDALSYAAAALCTLVFA